MYRLTQRTLISFVFSMFILVAGNLGMPDVALAGPLDGAKAAGIIGEMQNGYLGLVRAAKDEVKKQMDAINLQRRAQYREIAKKRRTSLAAVESLAGKAIIKKLPAGHYYRNAKGNWIKKKK